MCVNRIQCVLGLLCDPITQGTFVGSLRHTSPHNICNVNVKASQCPQSAKVQLIQYVIAQARKYLTNLGLF